MQDLLQQFILETILERKTQDSVERPADKLITEPDDPESSFETKKGLKNDPKKNEVSVAGAVAGVTTPLGTGPTYPNKGKRKIKPVWEPTARAFGGAVPVQTKKRRKK